MVTPGQRYEVGRSLLPAVSLLSLLRVTFLTRSSWLLLMGILELPLSRELLVEEEEEEGEGEEESLLVEREGMLVLRGRPDGFSLPRLTSLSTGDTDLKDEVFVRVLWDFRGCTVLYCTVL